MHFCLCKKMCLLFAFWTYLDNMLPSCSLPTTGLKQGRRNWVIWHWKILCIVPIRWLPTGHTVLSVGIKWNISLSKILPHSDKKLKWAYLIIFHSLSCIVRELLNIDKLLFTFISYPDIQQMKKFIVHDSDQQGCF